MHEVLFNRLGGLSLPRKSVIRLTDRPDMTLDVNRGRKTTMQQCMYEFSTKCVQVAYKICTAWLWHVIEFISLSQQANTWARCYKNFKCSYV